MDLPGVSPYAFHIGPLEVRWYGLMMVLSMAVGLLYFVREGKKHGYDEDFLYNLALLTILGGVVGARFIYVITNPGFFLEFPAEIIRIDHGGLSIHGALLGGFLTFWGYCRAKGVEMWPLLDWSVPGVAVGIVLVRIANIFNREILGHHAEILGGMRQPAQLYGSAIGLVILIVYLIQSRRSTAPGERFWTFFLVYTLLRGFIEETVRDNPLYIIHWVNDYWGVGAMTLTQWLTLPLLLFGWIMLRYVQKRAASRPTKDASQS
ncbi:MAG: prolipoprotein diacylglyceryl transferase [Bacillota bacterium]|nr:prolipoprotein diacylglyceryl transferase [Bacillota bacterium]